MLYRVERLHDTTTQNTVNFTDIAEKTSALACTGELTATTMEQNVSNNSAHKSPPHVANLSHVNPVSSELPTKTFQVCFTSLRTLYAPLV